MASPVVIVASGPSVTLEDIDLCRRKKVPFIVVNNAFEAVPDANIIVAGDYRWWKAHHASVPDTLTRISRSHKAEKEFGARNARTRLKIGYNSGMVAVEWAIMKRYAPIFLLGVDCSLRHGTHFHGDHKKTPNPDAGRIKAWRKQWGVLRREYPAAHVVNCSRYTELTAFPCQRLEDALCGLS